MATDTEPRSRQGEKRGQKGLCDDCRGPAHNEREKKQYQAISCLLRLTFNGEADRTPVSLDTLGSVVDFLRANPDAHYAHKPNGEPMKFAVHPTWRAIAPPATPERFTPAKPKVVTKHSLGKLSPEDRAALKITCTDKVCQAAPGDYCRTASGDLRLPHSRRLQSAKAAAERERKAKERAKAAKPKGKATGGRTGRPRPNPPTPAEVRIAEDAAADALAESSQPAPEPEPATATA